MKSAKSLTSALHSFFLLSSLLFLALFESSAHFPVLCFLNPLYPPVAKKMVLSLLQLLHQLTSLACILLWDLFPLFCSLLIFPLSLPLLCPPSALLYFSHCCFGLISLLAEAYWYNPTPIPPPPLTGVWAFNIQSMPPSSEPSFSTAGFDRQVPPLPPRPYRSQRMREKDAGREEGETEYTLRTAVAEQTDRWVKGWGGVEGRLWRVETDRKASLCWGWRGQADCRRDTQRKRRNWEFSWQLSWIYFIKLSLALSSIKY